MEYREELHWILDKISRETTYDESLCQCNIDFVHSLGLKCDCVGWCRLDLARPKAAEILNAIEAFCRKEGWTARGYYERTCVDADAEWYELKQTFFKDNALSGRESVAGVHGELRMEVLRAYRETNAGPKYLFDHYAVPERMRRVLAEVPELDFWWLRDRGRYAAEPYFALLPRQTVAHMGYGHLWMRKEKAQAQFPEQAILDAMGGRAPRMGTLMQDVQVKQPRCYLRSELPEGGVVWAYHRDWPRRFLQCAVLLHREVAQRLLDAKALGPGDLLPVPVVEELGPGYTLLETTPEPRPTAEALARQWADYEAFSRVSRPRQQVTQKQALTQLRRAKRERPEDFRKPLPKARAEALAGTAWEPLIPCYRITDGGCLDTEYEYTLLSQGDWEKQNGEFQAALAKEELLEQPLKGVKFGRCADGDSLLLCQDGTVVRFGHEEPVILEQWQSLHQFLFEILTAAGE